MYIWNLLPLSLKPMKSALKLAIAFALLILAACGAQKHANTGQTGKKGKHTSWFVSVRDSVLRQSLSFEYNSGTADYDVLTVYPKTDMAYAADYRWDAEPGSFRVLDTAIRFARAYNFYFGPDSQRLDDCSSVWLTHRNFEELQTHGFTVIDFRSDGLDTLYFKSTDTTEVIMSDRSALLQTVTMVSSRTGSMVRFVPDPDYPLIVSYNIPGYFFYLNSVQDKPVVTDKIIPGEGMQLQYTLTEFGTNTYSIHLSNTIWTDTLIRFDVTGTYEGSYTYDFDYVLEYRGKAVTQPEFEIPVIAAQSNTIRENVNNFVFLNPSELAALVKSGSGFLQVPHFAMSPDDLDSGYSESERKLVKEQYDNAWHTKFRNNSHGKSATGIFQYDPVNNAGSGNLAVYDLSSAEEISMQVAAGIKFPLVVYYNDHNSYTLVLNQIGFNP